MRANIYEVETRPGNFTKVVAIDLKSVVELYEDAKSIKLIDSYVNVINTKED